MAIYRQKEDNKKSHTSFKRDVEVVSKYQSKDTITFKIFLKSLLLSFIIVVIINPIITGLFLASLWDLWKNENFLFVTIKITNYLPIVYFIFLWKLIFKLSYKKIFILMLLTVGMYYLITGLAIGWFSLFYIFTNS